MRVVNTLRKTFEEALQNGSHSDVLDDGPKPREPVASFAEVRITRLEAISDSVRSWSKLGAKGANTGAMLGASGLVLIVIIVAAVMLWNRSRSQTSGNGAKKLAGRSKLNGRPEDGENFSMKPKEPDKTMKSALKQGGPPEKTTEGSKSLAKSALKGAASPENASSSATGSGMAGNALTRSGSPEKLAPPQQFNVASSSQKDKEKAAAAAKQAAAGRGGDRSSDPGADHNKAMVAAIEKIAKQIETACTKLPRKPGWLSGETKRYIAAVPGPSSQDANATAQLQAWKKGILGYWETAADFQAAKAPKGKLDLVKIASESVIPETPEQVLVKAKEGDADGDLKLKFDNAKAAKTWHRALRDLRNMLAV